MDPCSGHAVNEILGSPKAVENETVLVTGGSGFIGSHLVEMLLELGYTVRVYDNLETGNLLFLNLRHPRLHFVYGDIMDMDSMRHRQKRGGGKCMEQHFLFEHISIMELYDGIYIFQNIS